MTKKKALIITAKSWSKEDKILLKQGIDKQNYRWKSDVLTKEGQKKFCYFHSKVDLEIMALQEGFKILKVAKL